MDVDKTIQFLLEQQARFDTRQAQFEERMTQIQDILQDVAMAQERTNEILATVAEQHVELERNHKALSDAQRDTAQNLRALSSAQNVTEQNLNALIFTVERHIAGHS